MFSLIQWATLALGALTTILSSVLCCYFLATKHELGRSFAYMLLGEALMGLCAVVFTFQRFSEWDMNIYLAHSIRITTFGVASATSIHLAIVVRRVMFKQSE